MGGLLAVREGPLIIALDTSTLTLSLALLRREPAGGLQLVAEVAHGPPKRQSELLPSAIGQLLEHEGATLQQVEAIAVGLGPGSFTGLRVGLATAKGLAFAMKWKIAGASSLAALGLEGPDEQVLFPALVARPGHLYVGGYVRAGEAVENVQPEAEITPSDLARRMIDSPEAVALGPGVGLYRDELISRGIPAPRLLTSPLFPSAAAVARLARFARDASDSHLFALEPHYVRPSAAEENPDFPPLPGAAPVARLRDQEK